MKCVAVICLCLLAGASAAGADHPVVKVIKLLQGLKETSISEGKQEAVAYEKFSYWCSTSKADLKAAIADEEESIDELTDLIAGKKKAKGNLEGKISDLEDQIGDLEASAAAAKKSRKAGADLYDKVNKDLKATVKAMDDCIKALSGAEASTESMMLAQQNVRTVVSLISTRVTEHELNTMQDFAAHKKRPTQKAAGDLATHTDKYDFKSENVIELLKQLKLKFEDDQTQTTKEETNAINAYQLSKSARDNTIAAATKSKNKQTKELADTKNDLTQARKKKGDTESDHDADTKGLSDTDSSCTTKASEWAKRSAVRKNEIAAMDAAVEILGKATGVRTSAPGNPIPPASPVTFLQLQAVTDPKMKAVALLREAAKDAHSKALERLAMEVSNNLNGPFDNVNNMIEKMIFRLMDEQKSEDEHKLWCDEEIEKTNTMKDDKDDKIKDLNADIKVQKAAVTQLTEEIKDAEKMMSDIVSFTKEATEIRNTGKQENKLAIKDAQDAQVAVSNAVAVLTAFYKESGGIKKEAWEFLQAPVTLPKDPATWTSPGTMLSDPSKQPDGIIAVLEAVSADFSKMEAETKAQEATDQSEYERVMKENAIEKARRTKESEMKTAEKSRRVDKITSYESSKKDTSAELEKTEQYLVDLKPACMDGDSSYTDRKAARTKEIGALKTAQVTLQDAFKAQKSAAFLQK